jgi:exodeoxyribonuclease V alpha subunit
VARIVALLYEQAEAAGAAAPLIALAAPTGKAAARLEEAVHEAARVLPVGRAIGERLLGLEASTIHRLLGWRPDSRSRFRHHRGQRLPHDVVVVDETSMVSLSLMARLIESIRPEARLILVGDPGQLASIEAGAVLGDIVGPGGDGAASPGRGRSARRPEAGGPVIAGRAEADAAGIGAGIVVLDRIHRFGGGIARAAEAIRRGDGDGLVAELRAGREGVLWIATDLTEPGDSEAALAPVRARAVAAGRAVAAAARAGEASAALAALASFRVLCAHRRGGQGVARWNARIEGWMAAEVDGFVPDGRWWVGRPLLVTENDYELALYNGDTGVIVRAAGGDRVVAAFERRGEILEFSPTRLGALETVYAMTIHKSQGSQYDTAAVLLPGPASRLLTRELLYTAATRARRVLILAGTEEAIRAAVARPAARASGLRQRLWGG